MIYSKNQYGGPQKNSRSQKEKRAFEVSLIFILLGNYAALKDFDWYMKILAVSSSKTLKIRKGHKSTTGMKNKRKGRINRNNANVKQRKNKEKIFIEHENIIPTCKLHSDIYYQKGYILLYIIMC